MSSTVHLLFCQILSIMLTLKNGGWCKRKMELGTDFFSYIFSSIYNHVDLVTNFRFGFVFSLLSDLIVIPVQNSTSASITAPNVSDSAAVDLSVR